MTNYEQKLISDLRRAQGKAMGRLEKRIDRATERSRTLSTVIQQLLKRIEILEFNLLGDPPEEGEPEDED